MYLHWTGDDYRTVFPAYHFCIALGDDDRPTVVATHDLRANMRDVRAGDAPYAAHTRGRNSYAIGVSVCGMRDATPNDFGRFPLRDDSVRLMCALVADLARTYAIVVGADTIRTHAEAALDDGYFGAGDDERWDIARLHASDSPLVAGDARIVGDRLRERIARA
ncbi:MAG: hypothetical protein NVS2B8_02170 [Vulcanimicrobiaceae bacterium]